MLHMASSDTEIRSDPYFNMVVYWPEWAMEMVGFEGGSSCMMKNDFQKKPNPFWR